MQASILLPLARNLVDAVPVAGLVLWHLLIEVVLEVYNSSQTSARLSSRFCNNRQLKKEKKKKGMNSREIESNKPMGVDWRVQRKQGGVDDTLEPDQPAMTCT